MWLTQRFQHAGSVYGFVGATLGTRAAWSQAVSLLGVYLLFRIQGLDVLACLAFGDAVDGVDVGVDYGVGVVAGGGGLRCGFQARTAQDGLGAVMSGAYGDALGVEALPNLQNGLF